MNIIEKEILRAICYYNFYNIILSIFKRHFNINKIESFNNSNNNKIRSIIIRWIFILIMVRSSTDDPIFITQKSIDLESQIKIDIHNFFDKYNSYNIDLNKFSLTIINIIYTTFKEYSSLINTIELMNDNNVIINNNKLIYKSNSVNKLMNDPYVNIIQKHKTIVLMYYSFPDYLNSSKYNINTVFALYFRYKYLYTDNQTLAYKYTGNYNDAIECFSTPFNRYHNIFCSAFPDLEIELGSLGEFFDLINKAINNEYNFPINNLKINPIFDEIVDLRVSEMILKLLDTNKKYKISIILPNWIEFDAVNLLLNSNYLVKKELYKKGELYFKNYFTDKFIAPCDIIIIYLEN